MAPLPRGVRAAWSTSSPLERRRHGAGSSGSCGLARRPPYAAGIGATGSDMLRSTIRWTAGLDSFTFVYVQAVVWCVLRGLWLCAFESDAGAWYGQILESHRWTWRLLCRAAPCNPLDTAVTGRRGCRLPGARSPVPRSIRNQRRASGGRSALEPRLACTCQLPSPLGNGRRVAAAYPASVASDRSVRRGDGIIFGCHRNYQNSSSFPRISLPDERKPVVCECGSWSFSRYVTQHVALRNDLFRRLPASGSPDKCQAKAP